MANLSFDVGVDMTDAPDITLISSTAPIFSSSTELDFGSGFGEVDLHGKNFGDYDEFGLPHVGTIQGLDLTILGSHVATFSKMHLDMGVFMDFVAHGDDAGLIDYVLKGNDDITGSTQADTLTGLKGRDAIDGAGGNDILLGGAGGDTLTGGLGDDTFAYLATKESGKAGVDTITDLAAGDHIDLSAIDASTKTAGDQTFHIVAKLKGHAGEMTVVYDAGHDRTIVSMDVNGDQEADSIIWINGDHHTFSGWVL